MKIGIFGGAFNPVHYGHLLAAEQCREECALDEIWLVPVGRPSHRDSNALAPGADRATMLELATELNAYFVVKRFELERPGISYTVDTLEEINRATPDNELYLIMAADWLPAFSTWHRPRRIAELATLIAVNRGDQPRIDLEALKATLTPELIDQIAFVKMPGMGHSATDIRRRIRHKYSIQYLTPDPVVTYIAQHKLYAGS